MHRFLIILLLLYAARCPAQDYVVSVQHWDMKNGLIHRQVNSRAIDKDGFMWLATPGGLCRFDGYDFMNIDNEIAGLPFINIREIYFDKYGMMWLMGSSGVNNICLFDIKTHKAKRLKHQFSDYISSVTPLNDGRILIGPSYPGPKWYISGPNGTITEKHLQAGHDKGDLKWLLATSKNTIWFSSGNEEIYETDLEGKIIKQWSLPVNIGKGNKYFYWDAYVKFPGHSNDTIYTISNDRRIKPIHFIGNSKKSKADIIFSTELDGIIFRQGGLYHPSLGKLYDFTAKGWPELEEDIKMISVSSPGDLWLGGMFGLYHITIKRSPFTKYFYRPTNSEAVVNGYRGILVVGRKLLAAQDKWGLFTQGLEKKDSGRINTDFANTDRYTGIIQLKDSSIIFASLNWLWGLDKNATNPVLLCKVGPLPVWCIYEWSKDSLLLGTEEGLMWFLKKERRIRPFTSYNKFFSLREATVDAIDALPDGTIWLNSTNGLYQLDRKLGIAARYANDEKPPYYLPTLRFFSCTYDSSGIYWLATGSGLIRWNKNRSVYKQYTTKSGLSNNTIYSAYNDTKGNLWLPSDYGLMCFNKKTEQLNIYLVEDGLTSNEFNRTSHFRDEHGRFYFGSINGITAFHPDSFAHHNSQDRSYVPSPLQITAFRQFDGEKNMLIDRTAELISTHTIELHPGDRFFSIELALLNFFDVNHTTYYWMVDGLDKKWNLQKERTIRLSTLPFGTYKLRMAARSANGVFSKELIITLNVPAPFYRTWQFILVMALISGAIVAWLIQRKNIRVKKDNRRLEMLVEQRTHALKETLAQKDVLMKEIHHRVKNNLQMVTSLQRLQGAYSNDPIVKSALNDSQNRIISMAFIHHNLYVGDNSQNVEIKFFLSELSEHIANVFSGPDLNVKVELDVPNMLLDIDTAVPLGLIINELLTNSYKYAFSHHQGIIIIHIRDAGNGAYDFMYKDNGRGMPADFNFDKPESMGMRLVSKLSKQLAGKMQYQLQSGSCFTLRFYNFETRNNL